MSGSRAVAFDTSYVVAMLRGKIVPRVAIEAVVFPVTVVGELRFGALNSENPERQLVELDELIAPCEIVPIDEETAAHYAQTRRQLQESGRPIPENDVWIAAACIQHDLELLTMDRHFSIIEGLMLGLP